MVAANWNLCGVIFAWTTLRFLLSFRRLLFYRRALSRLALSRLVLCLLLPGFWFRVFRLRVLRLRHSKGRLRDGFGVVLWFRHRKRWLLRFCWLKAFFGPVTGVLAKVKANLWLIGGLFLRILVSIGFIAGVFCSFFQREAALTDRKSTRLNSSHVAISYAVFCLKKKKNTHRHRYSIHTAQVSL